MHRLTQGAAGALTLGVLMVASAGAPTSDRAVCESEAAQNEKARSSVLVVVPDVRGMGIDDALRKLRRAGLRAATPSVVIGYGGGPGPVLRQHPRTGMRISAGASVEVSFAPGVTGRLPASVEEVVVPNVVGRRLGDATTRLRTALAPLSWYARLPSHASIDASNLLDAFCVTSQTPRGGTRYVPTLRSDFDGGVRLTTRPVRLEATPALSRAP